MKKIFILPIIIALTIISCSDSASFSITENSVGPLTKNSIVSELSLLFENDSIVSTVDSEFGSSKGEVTIYEKGGKKLLFLTPTEDSNDSKIKFIQVFDPRYKTQEGITVNSTFKDISSVYEVRSVENLMGAVVIFVKDSDAYFTIDKKDVASDLMFDIDSKIELSQIPDEAPIKYFQIGWD